MLMSTVARRRRIGNLPRMIADLFVSWCVARCGGGGACAHHPHGSKYFKSKKQARTKIYALATSTSYQQYPLSVIGLLPTIGDISYALLPPARINRDLRFFS